MHTNPCMFLKIGLYPKINTFRLCLFCSFDDKPSRKSDSINLVVTEINQRLCLPPLQCSGNGFLNLLNQGWCYVSSRFNNSRLNSRRVPESGSVVTRNDISLQNIFAAAAMNGSGNGLAVRHARYNSPRPASISLNISASFQRMP